VPKRDTRCAIEYTVENIAALPKSPGLMSQVVIGVVKKATATFNQVPSEKEMYFLSRSCASISKRINLTLIIQIFINFVKYSLVAVFQSLIDFPVTSV